MKMGLLLVLILVFMACAPAAATQIPYPTSTPYPTPTQIPSTPKPSMDVIVESVRSSIVLIETDDGKGSGVFISSDGYILTNWHVIEGYSSIEIKINDSIMLTGSVVGYDTSLDLAVLKVPGTGYQYLELDANRPKPGEEVMIIGYPQSYILSGQASVTTGVVSGYESINGTERVQTDAAINSGNSGGAVISSTGNYIGVPTWIMIDATNIGFFTGFSNIRDDVAEIKAGRRDHPLTYDENPSDIYLCKGSVKPDISALQDKPSIQARSMVQGLLVNNDKNWSAVDIEGKWGFYDEKMEPIAGRMYYVNLLGTNILQPGQEGFYSKNSGGNFYSAYVGLTWGADWVCGDT